MKNVLFAGGRALHVPKKATGGSKPPLYEHDVENIIPISRVF